MTPEELVKRWTALSPDAQKTMTEWLDSFEPVRLASIAAERERCARILDERAERISVPAQSIAVLRACAAEDRYMASVLRCTCSQGLAALPANHATDCPTYLENQSCPVVTKARSNPLAID